MHVEQISNVDAMLGMLAIIAFAVIIFRVVPLRGEPPKPREYSDADLSVHDKALPKYMVVATAALVVGALHLAVRSVPAIATWLASGGYGGHLLRDIAYSHMMIVMGGTIAVTGLTWYCLPRILRCPLFSSVLSELAFWGTVVGAAGFYLANAVFGGVMAGLINAGWTQTQVDDVIGIWRAIATGLSATVMGLGYWTYVANVFLTALGSRKIVGPRPDLHLAKFFIVGAAGLLVGTVQGVLQVMPDNIDWLHSAGMAGRFIDPLSHAHVNLITGVLSILAGTLFYITRKDGMRAGGRRMEEAVFWTLIPGSVAFYLTFLILGFKEGAMIVGDGLSFREAAQALGWLHRVPLAASGAVTFLGIWMFMGITLKRLVPTQTSGRIAIMVACAALALGTLQGLAQAMPATRAWMMAGGAAGGAIADAHAQINIIGGVLLLLLGAMLAAGTPMTARHVPSALAERASFAMGSGALVYYAAAIAAALAAAVATHNGVPPNLALDRAVSWASPAEIGGALLYAAGAGLLVRFAWQATRAIRADGWQRFKLSFAQNDSSSAPWRRRIPIAGIVAPEFFVALFGFPGLGWILSGRANVGVPMMMIGAAISWAVIPLLLSPYGDGRLPHLTPLDLEVYLLTSTVASTVVLLAVMLVARAGRGIARPA